MVLTNPTVIAINMNTKTALSFEFFPPKTAQGLTKLEKIHRQLSKLNPEYFSVTFGAGGSTKDGTYKTVTKLQQHGSDAAPHLSCIASTKAEIDELLAAYKKHGIKRIVALRGDMPSGVYQSGEFSYAQDLVAHIRQTSGDYFTIEVAAYPEFHPQAQSAAHDFKHFVAKVNAGADGAITQYFYNSDAYFAFVERCQKANIDIPIVPGIMPITNFVRLARFSDACGAEIPRWIRKNLEAYGDDSASIKSFGIDVVTNLCSRLLAGGAPGLHFYTMNQLEPNATIWNNLKIS